MPPLLAEGKRRGCGVAILLFRPGCEACKVQQDILAAEAAGPDPPFIAAQCDATASAATRTLTARLGAQELPALFVVPPPAEEGATAALPRVMPLGPPARLKATLLTLHAPCCSDRSCKTATPAVAVAASAAPKGIFKASKGKKKSAFDPPAKGKAGATRSFPGKGTAIYWPRMPCLRCGCPWWKGEDWDATCIRCGWCCESEGYDDNSKPLAEGGWRERWEAFSALIKQGHTAAWPPAPA